ncbi:MAG: sugar ABC transporter permease, partial [Chloroflexota bacterium]
MAGDVGWQKWRWVLLFIAPSLIGLLIFVFAPIFTSLWLAFQSWNLLAPPKFVGLDNFKALVSDPNFWTALRYTGSYIVLYIPAVFVLALGLALLLNQKLRGVIFVRAVTFLPVVASWVVVSLIWKWIFNPQYGLVNYGLSALGIQGPAWLFDPNTALYAIAITSIWKDLGYVAVLYLGGLQSIAETYYEAARIDGAT